MLRKPNTLRKYHEAELTLNINKGTRVTMCRNRKGVKLEQHKKNRDSFVLSFSTINIE